ncbi:MAG: hypothetical protein MHMPM18_004267, partial [Marteilia pararefringens]
ATDDSSSQLLTACFPNTTQKHYYGNVDYFENKDPSVHVADADSVVSSSDNGNALSGVKEGDGPNLVDNQTGDGLSGVREGGDGQTLMQQNSAKITLIVGVTLAVLFLILLIFLLVRYRKKIRKFFRRWCCCFKGKHKAVETHFNRQAVPDEPYRQVNVDQDYRFANDDYAPDTRRRQ